MDGDPDEQVVRDRSAAFESRALVARVELDHALPGHVLDPSLVEHIEDALRELLRDRDGSGHRADYPDLRISSDSPLDEVVVQQKCALEWSGRALERVAQDPDQNRPRLEAREGVAHSLRTRDRVELQATLLESGGRREVIVGPERDGEDVGVVRTAVRRHPSPLRVDRRDPLLAKLDAHFGDVAVVQLYLGCGLAAEQNVQLREPEAERIVLVDERDADILGKRVGQSRSQFQAPETGPEDHDVLLHEVRDDKSERPRLAGPFVLAASVSRADLESARAASARPLLSR